jgi:hypothetical protein
VDVSFSSSRIGQFYFLTARWSTKMKSRVVKRVVDAISECITFLLFHLSHQTTSLRFRRHELLMLTTEMCALCTVIIRDGRKSFSWGNKIAVFMGSPDKIWICYATIKNLVFQLFLTNLPQIMQGDQEGLFELAIQKDQFFYSAVCNTATGHVLLIYLTDIWRNITATNCEKKLNLMYRTII